MRQHHVKELVGLEVRLAVDGDRDRLRAGVAGSPSEGAAGRDIVAGIGGSGVVLSGVLNGDGVGCDGDFDQRYGERISCRAIADVLPRHVGNRQRRWQNRAERRGADLGGEGRARLRGCDRIDAGGSRRDLSEERCDGPFGDVLGLNGGDESVGVGSGLVCVAVLIDGGDDRGGTIDVGCRECHTRGGCGGLDQRGDGDTTAQADRRAGTGDFLGELGIDGIANR